MKTKNQFNSKNRGSFNKKDGEKFLEIPQKDETIFVSQFQFNETNFQIKTKDEYCSLSEAIEDWLTENKKTSERKYKKFLMEKQKNFKNIHKSPMDFATPIGSPVGSLRDCDQLNNDDPFDFDFTKELLNPPKQDNNANDYDTLQSLGSIQQGSLKSGQFANQKKPYDTIKSNDHYLNSNVQVQNYLNNSNPNFLNQEYFQDSNKNIDPNLRADKSNFNINVNKVNKKEYSDSGNNIILDIQGDFDRQTFSSGRFDNRDIQSEKSESKQSVKSNKSNLSKKVKKEEEVPSVSSIFQALQTISEENRYVLYVLIVQQ